MTRALQNMPPIPSGAAWITYVRCHDDIGWAVTDEDAAEVGLSGSGHRAFLSDFYSGRFAGYLRPRRDVPVQPQDQRPAHQRLVRLAGRAGAGAGGGRPAGGRDGHSPHPVAL
jgi:hypothetical protein